MTSESVTIHDAHRLNAPGRFRIVFKMRQERPKSGKAVSHEPYFRSLSEASIAMLRLIEARGYRASECLGARVLDAGDRWPETVAYIAYDGTVHEQAPWRE